ncbi:MAG: hypothetical protein HZA50_17740 [Planctomycetes bacterium]|nr:hypothetical protein [Planctomycetota bacterium]
MRTKLILAGGFLGSGKTTLLARAAERLSARGLRVGLITNDQAANLVDTELLRQAGREVKEVSGACFCCTFNKLLYVCDNLINSHHPDVIIGEPVGSCTDLSATVLQPLKKFCSDRFDLAPYSVLVDPDKLQESLAVGQTHDIVQAVRYIYRKQIQEADLVVINKIDALPAGRLDEIKAAIENAFPGTPIIAMSALNGTGVDEWLDRMMSGGFAGGRIVEVDYEIYADGEAALGWLNAAVELSAQSPADWKAFAMEFLAQSQAEIRRTGGEIAHFKILLTAAGVKLQANLTSNSAEPMVQENQVAPSSAATCPAKPFVALAKKGRSRKRSLGVDSESLPSEQPTPKQAALEGATKTAQGGLKLSSNYATLIINARVRTGPEELKEIVKGCLNRAAGGDITVNVAEISSFRPGRPQPIHRFSQVVDSCPTED